MGMILPIDVVIRRAEFAAAGLKTIDQVLAGLDKKVKSVNSGFGKFLSLGLAMLFTGMAIQRVFGGLFRSMINSFAIAGNETSVFNQKTLELTAAWEFFKFSLIDALTQTGIFIAMIDFVVGLINFLNQLNPRWKKMIGLLIIMGVVAGTAMLIFGTGLLFVNGVATSLGVSLLGVVGSLVLIGVIAGALALVWSSDMSSMKKGVATLAIALSAVVGIILAILGVATIAVTGIVALMIGAALLIITQWQALGKSFVLIWSNIKIMFLSVVLVIVQGINVIIRAVNKLLKFLKLPTIPEIGEGKIRGSIIEESRRNIEIEKERNAARDQGFNELFGTFLDLKNLMTVQQQQMETMTDENIKQTNLQEENVNVNRDGLQKLSQDFEEKFGNFLPASTSQ